MFGVLLGSDSWFIRHPLTVLLWCGDGAWADVRALIPSMLSVRGLAFDHMCLCRAHTLRLYQFVFLLPTPPLSLLSNRLLGIQSWSEI